MSCLPFQHVLQYFYSSHSVSQSFSIFHSFHISSITFSFLPLLRPLLQPQLSTSQHSVGSWHAVCHFLTDLKRTAESGRCRASSTACTPTVTPCTTTATPCNAANKGGTAQGRQTSPQGPLDPLTPTPNVTNDPPCLVLRLLLRRLSPGSCEGTRNNEIHYTKAVMRTGSRGRHEKQKNNTLTCK